MGDQEADHPPPSHERDRLQLRFSQPRQAVLKKPNVESDPLLQQVYVRLAKIRDEAPASARLKHSQTAHNSEARLPRDATRLPFIQKDEVGWETLGQ